jgi:cytochrome c biogenesis protein CcmG/thiol:disulfide interchange protein DsbE
MNFLVETSKRDLSKTYSALGTPTAVAIRQDGIVGSYPIGGADGIRNLVANKGWTEAGFASFVKASSQPQPTTRQPLTPIGSQAPAFTLPDLEGKTVDSATFGGQETVLLFWNVGCGFCQRMLPQLIEWEKMRPKNAPRLVLVSGGSRETNAQMGLRSAIVLDDKFAVGKLCGANGTPSALLIDAKGKVASKLAVGASGVLDLLGAHDSDRDKPAMALTAANLAS